MKIWNKVFTCCFIANFLHCVSQFIVNPIVESYAALLGANAAMIGTIFGLFYGVAFALRVFSGVLITRYNKKYIMTAAYALGIVINLLYAVSHSVPVFVAARILHGVQFAFIGSVNLTIASDSLPESKMGSGIGMFGAGTAIATAIAPGLGMYLREWGANTWGGVDSGYILVFVIAAASMVVSLIPCLVLPYKPLTRDARANLGKWYTNIAAKEAALPAVVTAFVCFASMMYTSKLDRFAQEEGLGNIGIFFTVYAVVMLAARPLCGRLTDKWGAANVTYPGCVLMAAGFLLVGLGRTMPMILAAAVLAAVGVGAAQPALQAMGIKAVKPELRGVASNTIYFGMDLGYWLGPTIGGVIAAQIGHAQMFTLTVIPIAAAVAVLWLGVRLGRRKTAAA